MSAWERCVGATDERRTPAYIFEALGVEFDLDVAAPAEGPRHVPAHGWISRDSLAKDWYGFIWMNPPFGPRNVLRPWLEKFIAHGDGLALVPDRTSAPWFQEAAAKMDAILFLSPKVQFERADGSRGKSPGTGTALLAKGKRANDALVNASRLGLLVLPLLGKGRWLGKG